MKVIPPYKQIMIVLLALALAQLACSLGSRASNAISQPPQPTSQSTQAQSSSSGSCQNSYIPIQAGATWTYGGHDAAGTFMRTTTITSVEANSFERQVVAAQSNGVQRTYTDSWACTPDGLVLQGGPLATTFQSVYGNASMRTISSTGVTLPTNISAGSTWSQQAQLEFTSAKGSVNLTLNYSFKGIGLEQVTVTAGTFNAMEVEVNVTSQAVIAGRTINLIVDGFDWYAPNIGIVKSSYTVKLNGAPYPGTTAELQSYHIP
jgi:hypothetical protein